MRNSRVEVRPIASACGAEIDGVRIGEASSERENVLAAGTVAPELRNFDSS